MTRKIRATPSSHRQGFRSLRLQQLKTTRLYTYIRCHHTYDIFQNSLRSFLLVGCSRPSFFAQCREDLSKPDPCVIGDGKERKIKGVSLAKPPVTSKPLGITADSQRSSSTKQHHEGPKKNASIFSSFNPFLFLWVCTGTSNWMCLSTG